MIRGKTYCLSLVAVACFHGGCAFTSDSTSGTAAAGGNAQRPHALDVPDPEGSASALLNGGEPGPFSALDDATSVGGVAQGGATSKTTAVAYGGYGGTTTGTAVSRCQPSCMTNCELKFDLLLSTCSGFSGVNANVCEATASESYDACVNGCGC